jgi:RNA polymerase sigma-70 factor (ECF subfamily)
MQFPDDEFLPTRRTLLSRLRSWDDQESWHEFFATYGKLLYSFATKAGLRDAEAQDAVQETIISVAKELPGFKYDPARGSFKGWLKTVARRRIADRFRNAGRDQPATESADEPSVDPLESIWNTEWSRHVTQMAMHRLRSKVNQRQCQIFDLLVAQGLPVGEVARLMGVSHAHIYLVKHRLLRAFKDELRRVEAL